MPAVATSPLFVDSSLGVLNITRRSKAMDLPDDDDVARMRPVMMSDAQICQMRLAVNDVIARAKRAVV